eukprot:CAMPEP_0185443614 /NCGR_PEP_ID=MMETSP1365-20130426/47700_1 /TAXON_ID=38817 /ORGANISM="Gephyrocapsa oceanica, Strain RCC1303" /LENGTH=88 /DNA_ID=CAMNT_0028049233 /DNA_START=21 /DNA_END=282 /DNA_ORIENTATION=+
MIGRSHAAVGDGVDEPERNHRGGREDVDLLAAVGDHAEHARARAAGRAAAAQAALQAARHRGEQDGRAQQSAKGGHARDDDGGAKQAG